MMVILQNTIKLRDSYFLATFVNQMQVLGENISSEKIPGIYELLAKGEDECDDTERKSPRWYLKHEADTVVPSNAGRLLTWWSS